MGNTVFVEPPPHLSTYIQEKTNINHGSVILPIKAIVIDTWCEKMANGFVVKRSSGLPSYSAVVELHLPMQGMQEMPVRYLGRESPWKRNWQPVQFA